MLLLELPTALAGDQWDQLRNAVDSVSANGNDLASNKKS